jgi:hypothetical protein
MCINEMVILNFGDTLMDHDQIRKHIHELANNFFVLEGSLSRASKLVAKNSPPDSEEMLRLEKASEYLKKSIETLRSLREEVHRGIEAEKK